MAGGAFGFLRHESLRCPMPAQRPVLKSFQSAEYILIVNRFEIL